MDGTIEELLDFLEGVFDEGLNNELFRLLEDAFRQGLIDGEQLSLASAWVSSKNLQEH